MTSIDHLRRRPQHCTVPLRCRSLESYIFALETLYNPITLLEVLDQLHRWIVDLLTLCRALLQHLKPIVERHGAKLKTACMKLTEEFLP